MNPDSCFVLGRRLVASAAHGQRSAANDALTPSVTSRGPGRCAAATIAGVPPADPSCGRDARLRRAGALLGVAALALLPCLLGAGQSAAADARPRSAATVGDPLAGASVKPVRRFLAPSRAISCQIDWEVRGLPPLARCQSSTPPESVEISPSGTTKRCSGARCLGSPVTNAPVLAYGTSLRAGPFVCTSRVDGIACGASDRAFLISGAHLAVYPVLPHTTMAVYSSPLRHPTLGSGRAYGWLVALDRAGHFGEVEVLCGEQDGERLLPHRLWTVDLAKVRWFEVDTDPADEAAGSVVSVPRSRWVALARVDGWAGYLVLGGSSSYLSDGPGDFGCRS